MDDGVKQCVTNKQRENAQIKNMPSSWPDPVVQVDAEGNQQMGGPRQQQKTSDKTASPKVTAQIGKKAAGEPRAEDTTERSDWSDVEYGPGWEQVFDPSPANVTEQQMKQT
ncbi:expressed unknown protein [Seminavis robusta]|uniref:Uncharacterized protein n=1 Tax=Seminavis robusta TaxID=568900 RepID=A0A9N8HW57_9STRA|nr:expressed unknown protein [Seminavis robusta]|eukprot:Sro2094_g314170.1 n/a (111) ;mRNA; f:13107-13564